MIVRSHPAGRPEADADRRQLRRLRAAISARITRDLALLDAIDGDPDFEPDPLEEQHDAEDTNIRIRGGYGA